MRTPRNSRRRSPLMTHLHLFNTRTHYTSQCFFSFLLSTRGGSNIDVAFNTYTVTVTRTEIKIKLYTHLYKMMATDKKPSALNLPSRIAITVELCKMKITYVTRNPRLVDIIFFKRFRTPSNVTPNTITEPVWTVFAVTALFFWQFGATVVFLNFQRNWLNINRSKMF